MLYLFPRRVRRENGSFAYRGLKTTAKFNRRYAVKKADITFVPMPGLAFFRFRAQHQPRQFLNG